MQSVTLSGGTVTQPRSLKDKMSASWKFTVTYASGDSVVVDKTNMYLNVPAINANAGQNNADYKGTVKFAKYTLAVVISVLAGSIAAMSGITYVTGGAIAGVTENAIENLTIQDI